MTEQENETRNRILISIAAYAYEYAGTSIITDAEYDKLALQINKDMETGTPMLDIFFREEYTPHSGLWIHKHPEKHKLKIIFDTVFKHYETLTELKGETDA